MGNENLSVKAGNIWEQALDKLTLDGRQKVKERKASLSSPDTKRRVQPEEFTKKRVLDKVFFEVFNLGRQPGEKRFTWSTKDRSVDYCLENQNGDAFVVEAKPINGDLSSENTSSAVNQIKDVFELREGYENYEFGIATDGRRWIVINDEGEVVEDLEFPGNILRLQEYIRGEKKPVSEKRQEEITDRFYQWYDSLLHGGDYKDNEGTVKHISEEDCLVENIFYADEEDKSDIAQSIANRLIFIKFLQSKKIIGEDVLSDLKGLEESQLNDKMQELFFQVMNTPQNQRVNISEEFEEIPYLNGSLFKRNEAEKRNVDYQVKYDILIKFIEFLDKFAFVNKESLEDKEAIDPKILGYIFERAMTGDERKNTGAYYTPRAVTHYIAENTVYPTLLQEVRNYLKEEKEVREQNLPDSIDEMIRKHKHSLWDIRQDILIEDFKIIDPACGSGAFLLSVANILWDIHQRIDERIGDDYDDIWLKKHILRHNIYGVDINHKATEIARLRLWLWLVDSYSSNDVEALPNIDYNILSGNTLTGFLDITKMKEEGELEGQNNLSKWTEESLPRLFQQKNEQISRYRGLSGNEAQRAKEKIEKLDERIDRELNSYYITYLKDNGVNLDEETIEEFELFHWGAEFTEVYNPEKEHEERGFDVVVGNPPYVKYQKISEEMNEVLNSVYYTPYYQYDISIPFTERSHNLINEYGRLGFIMTKKWLKTNYGEELKERLKEDQSVEEMIDFTDQQVFKGVTTYTIILILNKKFNDGIRYGEISELDGDIREKLSQVKNKVESKNVKAFNATYDTLSRKNWTFVRKEKAEILKSDYETLQDYTESIFKGIDTSRNPVYVLELKEENQNTYRAYSRALNESVSLEKEICKPLAKGDDVKKWSIRDSGKIVIYPYEINEDDGNIIEKEQLENEYPKAWKYLKKNEESIKSRGGGKWRGEKNWYAYERARKDDIEKFHKEKAVIATLANRSKMSYDENGDYLFVGAYGITKDSLKDVSTPYIVGMMNSRLCEWMVQTSSSGFKGDSHSYARKYIKDIPIPTGEHTEIIEEICEDIIGLVNESREEDERVIEILENLLDFLTYEMYLEEYDSKLLEVTRKLSGLGPKEKAESAVESSTLNETVSNMKNDEKVEIIEEGKIRKSTFN